MRGRMRVGRAAYAAVFGLLLVVVGGCSDPEETTYTQVQVDRLTVDRPIAWATQFPVQEPWTTGFRLAPDSVEQIQLSGNFGDFLSASQAMGSLVGQAQVGLKDFVVIQSRDVEIKGATTGRITRYTITDNNGSQVSGEWIVAAHWPYPQSIAVSILQPNYDPEVERRVLDSLEMKPVLK